MSDIIDLLRMPWHDGFTIHQPREIDIRAADVIGQLRDALRAVVDNINDYERVNNLAPNPGRTECWDTVANAKRVLALVAGPAK